MGKYSDHRQGPGSPDRNPEGDIGPSKGPGNDKPDNFKGLALTDEDGNKVTFGEDKTPVGLTERYFTNNPENIQPAYDAGLMGTGLASTFSGQGLLNTKPITSANTNINPISARLNATLNPTVNQLALDEEEAEAEEKRNFLDTFKTLGEDAFVDRLMKMGVDEETAKLASATMNTSPEEAYGMVSNAVSGAVSSGEDMLGAGYNAAIASAMTPGLAGLAGLANYGFAPMFEAMVGPTIESASSAFANSKLGKYLQEKGLNIGTYKARKYGVQNPENIGAVALEDENFNNAFADPSVPFANITPKYTGPVTSINADEVAELQGGYLSPNQKAELAIERYNALETEKNNRPGNLAALAPGPTIDPVRSKYEDEALEAYDRYIESGYTPEEAEYLVAYMGLA